MRRPQASSSSHACTVRCLTHVWWNAVLRWWWQCRDASDRDGLQRLRSSVKKCNVKNVDDMKNVHYIDKRRRTVALRAIICPWELDEVFAPFVLASLSLTTTRIIIVACVWAGFFFLNVHCVFGVAHENNCWVNFEHDVIAHRILSNAIHTLRCTSLIQRRRRWRRRHNITCGCYSSARIRDVTLHAVYIIASSSVVHT